MNPNQGQTTAWNGGESVHYVDHADRYDRQLAPFTEVLIARADIQPSDRVLDVGCGCGVTTLQAAQRAGSADGVDISHPLTTVARDRALAAGITNVSFVVADAQTHAFAEAEFTIVVSQFGLMFFDDPVGAFANVRRSLADGGRITFVCWQELAANEWLTVVADAVAPHAEVPDFGGLAGGSGMFALKRTDEITALLAGVGFTQISVEPVNRNILLAGGAPVDESLDFLLGMGMVRGLLGRLDERTRRAAIGEIRTALDQYYEPDVGVSLGASVWLVSANR